MSKGEELLNINYGLHSTDSIENDGALIIDKIDNITALSSADRWRKENAIRCVVESVMWVQNITDQNKISKDKEIDLLQR